MGRSQTLNNSGRTLETLHNIATRSETETMPLPLIEAVAINPRPVTPKFNPSQHLTYTNRPEVLKMTDLGYMKNTGISPIAVTQPFQLFTREAVQIMRAEVLAQEVHNKFKYSSNINASQLRGYAKSHAPFTYEAWNHPETLAIVSDLAQVSLVPVMDYEIGHINFSTKTDEQVQRELVSWHEEKKTSTGPVSFMEKPIVGWHHDSYPFVCVLMLSNCENMIGGETALRTATGDIIKVRGPTQGCAVVLQGRYVLHQALQTVGATERITAVTSFRPKSSFVKDDSVLQTVRPVSQLSELYHGFASYRLKIMEDQIRKERHRIEAEHVSGSRFNTVKHKDFLKMAYEFLAHSNAEIVEEDNVIRGVLKKLDLADAVVSEGDEAKED